MTTVYKFKAGYSKAGVAVFPSVAPTIDIVDEDDNLLVNNGVCTPSAQIPGLYFYEYSGADDLALTALFHSTDTTMDQADLFAYVPAMPDLSAYANAMLDETAGVETGYTMRQALRLMLAALAGKVSGAGSATVSFRDPNDSKDRIVATVDAQGNRTAVVKDSS